VKLHPDALHHGVVFHHQFEQHSMKLYEVSVRLTICRAVYQSLFASYCKTEPCIHVFLIPRSPWLRDIMVGTASR
jgi:hypothetical protein